MSALAGAQRGVQLVRRVPQPGEIGCVGSCPLCSGARGAPPCLACRDEMRERLAEMQLQFYVERAMN